MVQLSAGGGGREANGVWKGARVRKVRRCRKRRKVTGLHSRCCCVYGRGREVVIEQKKPREIGGPLRKSRKKRQWMKLSRD